MRTGGVRGTFLVDDGALDVTTLVVSGYLMVTGFELAVGYLVQHPIVGTFEWTAALPIPLVLALGYVAIPAIPLGYVLGDTVSGGFGVTTMVVAVAHLFVGYATVKFAGRYELNSVSLSSLLVRGGLRQYVTVVAVSTAGAAAITGWGYEIFRVTPFHVGVVSSFVGFFAVALVATIPVLAVFRYVLSRWGRFHERSSSETVDRTETFGLRRVALVTATWLLLGSILSLGYRTFERVPADALARRNLDVLLVFEQPGLFGSGAGRIQVVLGAILVSILVTAYAGSKRGQGGAPA